MVSVIIEMPIKIRIPAMNGFITGTSILKNVFRIIEIPREIRKVPIRILNSIKGIPKF